MATDETTKAPRTAAEQVVRAVAIRIGMEENDQGLTEICNEMKKEYIREVWQLAALDSFQWQSLGAPIGLAVAVRTLAASSRGSHKITRDDAASASRDELPSMIRTSKTAGDSRKNTRPQSAVSEVNIFLDSSLLASLESKTAKTVDPDAEARPALKTVSEAHDGSNVDEESPETEAAEHNEQDSPTERELPLENITPTNPIKLMRALRQYHKSQHIEGRPFPVSDRFNEALTRCKSGADLKNQMVFSMELNVLASALLLGAAIELWGVFPMDAVGPPPEDPNEPYVPKSLAMVYNFSACASLMLQLTCTSGWIWSLRAMSAVSANKFKIFLFKTRFLLSLFDRVFMFGQLIFVVSGSLLLGGVISALTADPTVRQLGFYAPVVALLVANRFVHNVSSYIGRVAYHGFLLIDGDPEDSESPTTTPQPGCAADFDRELNSKFQRDNVFSEHRVMDIYTSMAATTSTQQIDDDPGARFLDRLFSNRRFQEPIGDASGNAESANEEIDA